MNCDPENVRETLWVADGATCCCSGMSVVRSLRPLSRLSRLCRRLPLLTLHPDLPRLRQGTCRLISSDHHSELQFEKKIDNALESLNDQLEEVLCRANIKDYDVSLNVRLFGFEILNL